MPHDGHDHSHPHAPTVHEHKQHAPTSVAAFVVTCSDTRDEKRDAGGRLAKSLLEGAGHTVVGTRLVKDDAQEIGKALDEALAAGARAVVFTGGTGLSRRDVTVEALTPRFEKTIPGFGELFRVVSHQEVGPAALLSRAVAGTVQGAVVFALPGSPNGVRTALEKLILPELGHLVRELSR